VYNLNYSTSTTLGVKSCRKIRSRGTRTKRLNTAVLNNTVIWRKKDGIPDPEKIFTAQQRHCNHAIAVNKVTEHQRNH
jgi:hypothetical protein